MSNVLQSPAVLVAIDPRRVHPSLTSMALFQISTIYLNAAFNICSSFFHCSYFAKVSFSLPHLNAAFFSSGLVILMHQFPCSAAFWRDLYDSCTFEEVK